MASGVYKVLCVSLGVVCLSSGSATGTWSGSTGLMVSRNWRGKRCQSRYLRAPSASACCARCGLPPPPSLCLTVSAVCLSLALVFSLAQPLPLSLSGAHAHTHNLSVSLSLPLPLSSLPLALSLPSGLALERHWCSLQSVCFSCNGPRKISL